jgi:hypothetical protein
MVVEWVPSARPIKASRVCPVVRNLKYDYHPRGSRSLELSFENDDFEGVVREIRKFDLRVLHNVSEDIWGLRTARLYDPESNIAEIGESMLCFVRRLSEEGLWEKEITEKT